MYTRHALWGRSALVGVAALAALGLSAPAALSAAGPPMSAQPLPAESELCPIGWAQCAPYPALFDTSPNGAYNAASVDDLLNAAAVTQANAHWQYNLYAEAADHKGRTNPANVWRSVADVEYWDHYKSEIMLSEIYSNQDNMFNVRVAILQAHQAEQAYLAWANEAPDRKSYETLRSLAKWQREAGGLLIEARRSLEAGMSKVPYAPPVRDVPLKVTPKPNYTEPFYSTLTGASDSALGVAAWQWGQYETMAEVAVSTGQAKLGALLAGLGNQEVQNYRRVSNLAGFVNGPAMNLQVSIDSEQGAIDYYTAAISRSNQLGDPNAAGLFRDIKTDEQGHKMTFEIELARLTGKDRGYEHGELSGNNTSWSTDAAGGHLR